MRSPLLTVMGNAAIKAAKGLLRDFGEVTELQISRKGTSNFVTKSDLRAEKLLVAELRKARPDFGFLLEEGGEIKGKDADFRFIIDPLDGTSNFIHAVPYFCISIAVERTVKPGLTEITAGVIYDPIHNELFTAEKNRGAAVNDRRIAVSGRAAFEDAMLATGNPRHNAAQSLSYRRLQAASASGAAVRYTGAAALDLAYVAAGRYDGCWFDSVQPWDVAAGMLLVQEAGGIFTDCAGNPTTHLAGSLLASNPSLHARTVKLLAG